MRGFSICFALVENKSTKILTRERKKERAREREVEIKPLLFTTRPDIMNKYQNETKRYIFKFASHVNEMQAIPIRFVRQITMI